MLDEDGGLNVKRGGGGGENWIKCLKRRLNEKKGEQTKNLKTGECWVKGVGALEIMTPYKLCKEMLLRRVLRSLSNIYDGAFCKNT